MRKLIIIALLVMSYGCAPRYFPVDPLPVEQRNGLSSQTIGFIKPDKRTVAYTYSFPSATKNLDGYVYGSGKNTKSGYVYSLDVNTDLNEVVKNYINIKFLKQTSQPDVHLDFTIKDFWIENGGGMSNRGGTTSKTSYITILNAIVNVKITDETKVIEKSFELKRVIEKSSISTYVIGAYSSYTATSSNSNTFIDTDMSMELTEMYNILVLMTDKFIESAKSDKPSETESSPAVYKKTQQKDTDLFQIK